MLEALVKQGDDHTEAAHLLSGEYNAMEMSSLSPASSEDKNVAHIETRYVDDTGQGEPSASISRGMEEDTIPISALGGQIEYRTYQIRWFGLVQLVLLNIIVSWDVSTSSYCRQDVVDYSIKVKFRENIKDT